MAQPVPDITVPERYRSKPSPLATPSPEGVDISVPERYRSKPAITSEPVAVEANPFTIFATPQVPAKFPARDEPLSPEEQRKAREKALKDASGNIYGTHPYDSVVDEYLRQSEIDSSAYTPSAKPSVITPYVDPSVYVPQTEYKDIIDTPEYSKLRAIDAANAKSIAAQGGGTLDPLRPRTLDSDYAAKVKQYKENKDAISQALKDIVEQAPQYSIEQRQAAKDFYKENFPWAPEIGAYFQAAVDGKIKSEDVPKVLATLEPSFERINPEHSILPDTVAMTEGIPVVGTAARLLSENVTQPLFGFKQGSNGELVEPATLTALRGFNSPTGAVAGAIEGAASVGADVFTRGPVQALADAPQTISGAAGRYIREGRGFTDAASQIGGRVGANIDQLVGYLSGYTPEESKIYGEAQPFLAEAGLVAGLALDLYLGPDEIVRAPFKLLELGQAARLADIAINAPKVSEAAMDASRVLGRPAADRVAVEGTEALKQFKPTALVSNAADPHEAAAARFVRDNEKLAEILIETSKEPVGKVDEAARIAAGKPATDILDRVKSGIAKVDGRDVASITDNEALDVATRLDRAGFLGGQAARKADGSTVSAVDRLNAVVQDSQLSNGLLGQLYSLKEEVLRNSPNPKIVGAELDKDLAPIVQETSRIKVDDLLHNQAVSDYSSKLDSYLSELGKVKSIDDLKNIPSLDTDTIDELVAKGIDIPSASAHIPEVSRIETAIANGANIIPEELKAASARLRKLESRIQKEFKERGVKVPGELIRDRRILQEAVDGLKNIDSLSVINGIEVVGQTGGKRLIENIAQKELRKVAQLASALEDIKAGLPAEIKHTSSYALRARGIFPQAREELARALSQKVAQRNYLTAIRSGIRKALPTRAAFSSSTELLAKDIIRISPDTYVTKAAAKKIVQNFKESAVARLRSGKNINISEALKELQDIRYPKLNEVNLSDLKPNEYQDIVDFVMKDAGRKQKFWLSTEDVARAVEDLSQKPGRAKLSMPTAVGLKDTALTFKNELKATQLRQALFTPKEIEASFLANSIWGAVKLLKGGDEAIANPIVNAFTKEVKNAWGSIWDKFKIDQRAARRSGLSWEEASTKVVVGANPDLYFDEFLKTIYGGTNRVETALAGRDAKVSQGLALSSPKDVSNVVDLLVTTHPDILRAKKDFILAMSEGRYTDALEKLHATMGALQGRTISSLFSIETLTEAFKSSPELKASFKRMRGEAAAIHLDNFQAVLPITHFQLEQVRILRDLTSRYAEKFPATLSLAGSLADTWFNEYKRELVALSRGRSPEETRLVSTFADALEKFPKLRTLISNEDMNVILTSKLLNEDELDGIGSKRVVYGNALAAIFNAVIPSDSTWSRAIGMSVDDMVSILEKKEAGLIQKIKNNVFTVDKLGNVDANEYFNAIRTYADEDLSYLVKDVLNEKLPFRSPFLNGFVETRLGGLPALAKEEGAENIKAVISASAKFKEGGTSVDEIERLKQYYKGGATSSQLLGASNIEQLTNTLQRMIIPKGDRAVSETEALAIQDVLDMKLNDIVEHAKLVKAPIPPAVSVIRNAWDAGKNMSRQGILAGQWWTVGNPVFHTKNILENTLVTLNTVGAKSAAHAATGALSVAADTLTAGQAGKFVTLNNDTAKIFRAIFNPDAAGDIFNEVVTTASGRTFTVRELVDAISSGSVMRSQAGVELTHHIFEDFSHYLARENGSMKKVGNVKTLFERTTGGALGTKENIFSRFADATDVMFRVSVFTGAIKEGRSVEEATRLAREALFDYGSVSKFERDTIARGIWFYTFWSRNLITNIKNVLSHPGRLTSVLDAKSALEKDQQANYAPDYAQINLFRTLTEDKETKARFQTMGIGVPQFQATSDLIDYMGLLAGVGGAAKYLTQGELRKAVDLGGRTSFDLFTNISGKSSPLPKLIVGGFTGYDLQRGGKALPFIDAKLAWWLHQRPEMWQAFSQLVPLVQVTDADKLDPEYETYMGSQWKVKPGYENRWYAIQQVLIPLGIARAARNYPDLIEAVPENIINKVPASVRPSTSGQFLNAPSAQAGGDITDNKFIYPSRLDALMYATGVEVKRNTPTLEELRIQIEKDKLNRIKSR